MSFSYSQFEFCVRHFETVSKDIYNEWCVSQVQNNEIFLKKITFDVQELEGVTRNISWEYHIIYSYSYLMPILYFNVCFDDGKLLSLKQIELLINPIFRMQFMHNKSNYLSQQEHPYMRRPFFILHPCGTENFMTPFLSNSPKINPLVTWLSSVAPVVNLHIDLRFSLHFDYHKFRLLPSIS